MLLGIAEPTQLMVTVVGGAALEAMLPIESLSPRSNLVLLNKGDKSSVVSPNKLLAAIFPTVLGAPHLLAIRTVIFSLS